MTATETQEHFADVGGGITLCYETFGDPADPPVLLIMGLGMQLLGWDARFCQLLADRGFYVVRFDNRDAGLSTSIEAPVPSVRQLATRRFDARQYDLGDMAADAVGLLRELDLAPAHVVGASLGGMVAQTMAARSPESVRTLTSIMSTTGHRLKGQPAPSRYRYLLRPAPREREAYVDYTELLWRAIGSPGFEVDPATVRERAGRSFDRARNPAGTGRQMGAVLKSGDRTRELRAVTAPTLVIHGSEDTLVRPSGGRATAAAIPGAELMLIEGMGHDLPPQIWERVVDAVAERARRFDGD